MILIGKKADIITRQAIYREAHSLLTVSQLKLSTKLDGQTLLQRTHQKGNYGTAGDPDMSVQAFTSKHMLLYKLYQSTCQSVLEPDNAPQIATGDLTTTLHTWDQWSVTNGGLYLCMFA